EEAHLLAGLRRPLAIALDRAADRDARTLALAGEAHGGRVAEARELRGVARERVARDVEAERRLLAGEQLAQIPGLDAREAAGAGLLRGALLGRLEHAEEAGLAALAIGARLLSAL